ncbi:MAG: cytochrome c family protein [Saprospiraceae bacterium]|nr:cytochrome c family protein [Saprospiraceae bacterium]
MKLKTLLTAVVFTCLLVQVQAQLSPGDLAKPHAQLEGVANCTKCHVLGDKVSNDKCLSCHKEVKSKLDQGAGYHASSEAKGKECASCHNDHHGRNFNLIRFDKDKFNHNLTGYELTGSHKTNDCRKCHKPELIQDAALKKKTTTYLGLRRDCKSCHADVHQTTLTTDCAKCHTTEKFAPAAKFDHNKSDYPLVGAHKTVACIDCHKKETRGGKEFQRFADVPFTNCNSCHKDPHQSNLGTNCKECHSEQSFTAQGALKKYNHGQTHFPLKGKHQQVDCAKCHNMVATPLTVFQDKLGIQTTNCVACHKDVHEKRFGTNCVDCHSEKTFQVSGVPKNFDHNKTGFGLEGKHQQVDCKKCHTSEHFTDPQPHQSCATCHKDYHEGQMASAVLGISPDCASCHTVEGFTGSSYSIAEHNKTKFPLTGAHMATPCLDCHKPDKEKWKFKNIGSTCVDCHKDVHEGFVNKKYYPDKTCEKCHVTDSWTDNRFDHNLTKFKLEGAHTKQSCMACHGKKDDTGKLPQRYQKFTDLPTNCTSCHKNVHDTQFEKNGVTDCVRCHGQESWKATKFDHNKTKFKLDGKHVKVDCAKCHKPALVNGEQVVQYKLKSFECIDCHQ